MTRTREPWDWRVMNGTIEYTFPLSTGQFATLMLPVGLSAEDAERLTEFLDALVQEQREGAA